MSRVRAARPTDRDEVVRMRTAFWPDSEAREVDALLGASSGESVVLVAERPDGGLCGFAEVGVRAFADGCSTSPVGYLEGIWVDPDARRRGIASRLLDAALDWARARGLSEFASDAAVENAASLAFHAAVGFREAQRLVAYRIGLDG